ncbi:MAG: SDR family oxidoreductase [Actinomycetota bacterium]|nr:SDR family oxidoreductase [Actinomycetota bacterium]
MNSVQGKVAVVTGAASGIGRGCARALGARGAIVVVADIDVAGSHVVAQEIQAAGGSALAVRIDVGEDSSFEELKTQLLAEFGRADIVMNNAGVITRGLPEHIPLEEWHRVINVNLFSVVRSHAAFLPLFLKQGSGHFVNTASFAGLMSYSYDRMPYSASKAAIIQISEGLALYAKPQGIGVTVLCPGPVATNIGKNMPSFGPDTPTRGPGPQFQMRDAQEVGNEVVDAIEAGQFWLPTDYQIREILVSRAADWDAYVDRQIESMK